MATQCPSMEQWQMLVDELLDPAEEAELQDHLEYCGRCQDVLVQVASQDEPGTELTERLRRQEDALRRDAALQRAMDEIRAQTLQAGTAGAACSPADMTLEFLAPAETPDHLGRLGPYQITELVGCGGMGMVLKGHDPRLNRFVAIKVLAPSLAAGATARKRFRREGQAAAAVTHDHVITIHAVDESDGLPYLVMEYIAGRSLEERIKQTGPLELKEILRIGMQTANGLAAAHAQGLVHRDIKPANILLENGVERVKITDFGLARAVDDVRITQPGVVTGTPEYMSPEQARGEPVDHRSDLFSLGCVLYAMCTGRPPFRAENTVAMVHEVCEGTPSPIAGINPEIPDWLSEIIHKLLAKDPQYRFQSAAEIGELLGAHLAHLQQPSVHCKPARIGPSVNRGRVQRNRARSRGRLQVAAIVAILLLGGWGLSEATGVTEVVATLIRVVRGDGTLVVEVDDPNIQVLIDGEELVITGAGPKEIRLRPGKHEVHAVEDGKPIETKLVTITRGGREVVKVTREELGAARKGPADLSRPLSATIVRRVRADFDLFSVFRGISPDGRYIAHTDRQSGDLAIHELASGENRRLTKDGSAWKEFTVEQIFSPDGQKLAFNWLRKDRSYELRIVALDGSDPRTLFHNPDVVYLAPLDWSSNGRHILTLLGRKDKSSEISLISVEDGSVKTLKTFKAWEGGGSRGNILFSPDGRYVIYDSPPNQESPKHDIFLLTSDASSEIALVEHPANDTVLGWSPDGRHILFSSDRRGVTDAWLIPVSGGKADGPARLLLPNLGEIGPMGFTRDGAFYYITQAELHDVYMADIDLEEGRILNGPKAISVASIGSNYAPDWSPDGRHLAYISQRDPDSREPVICIRSLATAEERNLGPGVRISAFRHLRWFPDGQALAVGAVKGDQFGVFRIDAQSGEAQLIVRHKRTLGLAIAPDGKTIFDTDFESDGIRRRLLKWDLKSGQEQVLHRYSGLFELALSPDGQHLAFWASSREDDRRLPWALKTIPTSGGQPLEILELEEGASPGAVTWTPDGKHLLFVKRIKGGKPQLWKVSVQGGQSKSLGSAVGLDHLRLHPDGRRIAFSAARGKRDLWVMENFLPPLKAGR